MSNLNWYVIVNPTSGRGKGLREWPVISSLLREASIGFDADFTLRKFHAVSMTFDAIEAGYRNIIVVGGDGTLSEVVCGIMMQSKVPTTDITLSLFALGDENDWMKMFGVPKNYGEVVRAIQSGKTFLQDVGKVTYYESKVQQTRYICNSAGVAYSARMRRRVNRLKSKGYTKKWRYRLYGFKELFKFRRKRVAIWCDGAEVYNAKLFSANIGIGRFSAKGLSHTPYAVVDDGLFDLTVVRRMSLFTMLFRLKALRTGNIYSLRGVEMFRAVKIEMRCEGEIGVEIDGENGGVSDFTFEVVPRAIRVVVSEKFIPKE